MTDDLSAILARYAPDACRRCGHRLATDADYDAIDADDAPEAMSTEEPYASLCWSYYGDCGQWPAIDTAIDVMSLVDEVRVLRALAEMLRRERDEERHLADVRGEMLTKQQRGEGR